MPMQQATPMAQQAPAAKTLVDVAIANIAANIFNALYFI